MSMSDFEDDDGPERPRQQHGTPTERVYVHTRCGGQTRVSGRDFTHITDPFWACTSTYCCTCAGFAPFRFGHWAARKTLGGGHYENDIRNRPRTPRVRLALGERWGRGRQKGS